MSCVIADQSSHPLVPLPDESGALNEAISDIFGACVDRQMGASKENTWKCGEKIVTPEVSGDAMRYMNDPALALYHKDFFADRYQGSPTARHDNGGVHWNSCKKFLT